MKLKVINSNSSGNAYLLIADSGDTLLVECGVHISKIKKALGYNLRNVRCILSHSHGDHASAIKDVLAAGIPVFSGKETLQAKGVYRHHRAFEIEAGKMENLGEFKVKPFSLNHDVPCFGFLIQHPESGLILFLTDTYYCDYRFNVLNNIIIECNHDEQLLEENSPKFLRHRIIQSHMNVETCKGLLKANDLTRVNNICLIHLSNDNSDAAKFQKEINELTGKAVHVAAPGLVIDFNKCPF